MNNNNAFTLIELSIVLIIISLIVTGIIGGKALIQASELNSVVADVNGFKSSINAYQMQYDALPGDHRNASSYWSVATDGDRSAKTLKKLYERIKDWDVDFFCTDELAAYAKILPKGRLVMSKKLTIAIE